MSRSIRLCAIVALVTWLSSPPEANAQRGVGAGPLMGNPIIAALDENHDGEITANEIDRASESLRKLDTNGDGMLTPDELGPGRDRLGPGGGTGPGGPGDRANRLLQLLEQSGGKLAIEKLPERARPMAEQADADGDGFLTREEIGNMRGAGIGRGQSDAAPEADPQSRPPRGRGAGGFGPGGFGPGGGGEQFLDRLFENDTDGDGKLSREELAGAAQRMRGAQGENGNNPPRRNRGGGDN